MDSCRLSPESQPRLVLLDVRPELQFNLMHLPGAVSVPLEKLPQRMDSIRGLVEEVAGPGGQPPSLLVYCRRGIASQKAVQQLHEAGLTYARDIRGGITRWATEVDACMPAL